MNKKKIEEAVAWVTNATENENTSSFGVGGKVVGDAASILLKAKDTDGEWSDEMEIAPIEAVFAAFELFKAEGMETISASYAILAKALPIAGIEKVGGSYRDCGGLETHLGRCLTNMAQKIVEVGLEAQEREVGIVDCTDLFDEDGLMGKLGIQVKTQATNEENEIKVVEIVTSLWTDGHSLEPEDVLKRFKNGIANIEDFENGVKVVPFPTDGSDVREWVKNTRINDKNAPAPEGVAVILGRPRGVEMDGLVIIGNDFEEISESLVEAEELAFEESIEEGRRIAELICPVRMLFDALIEQKPVSMEDFSRVNVQVVKDFLMLRRAMNDREGSAVN
jgi:hypothetical protein